VAIVATERGDHRRRPLRPLGRQRPRGIRHRSGRRVAAPGHRRPPAGRPGQRGAPAPVCSRSKARCCAPIRRCCNLRGASASG
jgi:hypothetical protein